MKSDKTETINYDGILNNAVLSSEVIGLGLEQFTLDLELLYENTKQIDSFNKRWEGFFNSDSSNKDIMKRERNKIIYLSESVISEVKDNRPPAVFVFGNPAPHSIKAGTPCASEGIGSEHRIWKVLKREGILDFNFVNSEDINHQRKHALHSGNYVSPYRIGILQYFSMSSTPSAQPWAGVSGLVKLFGSKAIKVIEKYEIKRIQNIVNKFFGSNNGLIITFQKDAYNGLINQNADPYSSSKIRNSTVEVSSKFGDKIKVVCAPPTRLIYSKSTSRTLKYVKDYYDENHSQ